MTGGPADGVTIAPRSPLARGVRIGVVAVVAALILSLPWTGPVAMRQLVFFRVRKVEIRGAVYLTPSEILGKLRVDSTANVWDDPSPLVARLMTHPQIRSVMATEQERLNQVREANRRAVESNRERRAPRVVKQPTTRS